MLNAAELEFCSEHHITARTEFRAGWMKRLSRRHATYENVGSTAEI